MTKESLATKKFNHVFRDGWSKVRETDQDVQWCYTSEEGETKLFPTLHQLFVPADFGSLLDHATETWNTWIRDQRRQMLVDLSLTESPDALSDDEVFNLLSEVNRPPRIELQATKVFSTTPSESPFFCSAAESAVGRDLLRLTAVDYDAHFVGLDFRLMDCSGSIFASAMLSGCDFQHAKLEFTNFSKSELAEVNFSNAYIRSADFNLANLEEAKFIQADLMAASLRGARMHGVDMSQAFLRSANLGPFSEYSENHRGEKVVSTFYTELDNANIKDGNFSGAILNDLSMLDVTYDRSALNNSFGKAYGIASIRGNPMLVRDIEDQNLVDAKWAQLEKVGPPKWRHSPLFRKRYSFEMTDDDEKKAFIIKNAAEVGAFFKRSWKWLAYFFPYSWRYIVWLFKTLDAKTISAGALVGVIISAILGAVSMPPSEIDYEIFLGLVAGGSLIGSFASSWYGDAAIFKFWQFLDFGRDWLRVVLLAFGIVFMFGLFYGLLPDHFTYSEVNVGVDNFFRPFFVAALGFATLGVSDVIRPETGLGQLIILGNVLSGFVTLGLLLAILANAFSRK